MLSEPKMGGMSAAFLDSDGNLMMRMGDHMAMDMDTGDIHMISSWSDDDEE